MMILISAAPGCQWDSATTIATGEVNIVQYVQIDKHDL